MRVSKETFVSVPAYDRAGNEKGKINVTQRGNELTFGYPTKREVLIAEIKVIGGKPTDTYVKAEDLKKAGVW